MNDIPPFIDKLMWRLITVKSVGRLALKVKFELTF